MSSSSVSSVAHTFSHLSRVFPTTPLTHALSLRYPIIQAPMSPITSASLVSAVCEAGGMGSIAGARMSPTKLKQEIQAVRSLTNHPFAVNLFIPKHQTHSQSTSTSSGSDFLMQMNAVLKNVHETLYPDHEHQPFIPLTPDALITPKAGATPTPSPSPTASSQPMDYEAQVEVVLSERVPVFSWTFGIPSLSILQRCRQLGIKTIGTATTPYEAWSLAATELVDAIVVQGSEAGGHRGTFSTADDVTIEQSVIGLMSLLPLCRTVVPNPIPLIAAGGIHTGDSLVACLLLGAQAVSMGTAFLTVNESTLIHPKHKQLLLRAHHIRTQHQQTIASGSADTSSSGSGSGDTGDNSSAGAPLKSLSQSLAESYRSTTLTRVFSGRPARGFYNAMIHDFHAVRDHMLPWGIQASIIQPYVQKAMELGRTDYMQLWTGQAYPFCTEQSAAALIEEIIEQAKHVLR